MKKKLFYLFTFLSTFSFSQFSKEEVEMTEVIKEKGAYISPSLFLDTSVISDMKLVNSSTWRNIWADIEDTSKNIIQLYDIRLKFDSKKEALKFHKKFIGLNSEFGPKLSNGAVKFIGATSPFIYGSSKSYDQMMGAYGYHAICFLFVVDSYFVKFYITCKKELKPADFQKLIDTSISRIKNKK